jgi:hypothetical protein|tara:strand:+ start:2108 stop:2356 length:249 start_codon:yes stop_codon:yes gene_type:complete
MTKEHTADLLLLIAMFRCFNEQLYNLKGAHAGIIKLKFNRLLKVAAQYERQITQWTEGSKELELIYDSLMEVLIEVKTQVNE